jgi:hypothetical protein
VPALPSRSLLARFLPDMFNLLPNSS